MSFGVVFKLVVLGMMVVLRTAGQKVSSFSCNGRTAGYYADVSTGCQVYHMCDGLGRQFSYKCPSKTLFQQRMLICDHWYMVNCSKAEQDYSANLLIGQRGKAFVEELEYSRTPRPDLVDPNNSDFTTYRLSFADLPAGKTIVGTSSDDYDENQDRSFSSHNQVTESYEQSTASSKKRQETGTQVQGFNKQVFYRTNYDSANQNGRPKGKNLAFNSFNRNDNQFAATTPKPFNGKDSAFNIKRIDTGPSFELSPSQSQNRASVNTNNAVNFPSNFKATTPVYPKEVDVDQSKFFEFSDPLSEQKNDGEVDVNFPSNFKATTPVYPSRVDIDPSKLSEFDIPINEESKFPSNVNFPSKFKATTPVYPKHVDVDLSKFSEFQEQPPEKSSQENAVVNFASNFKATTPVYPKQVDVDLTKFSEPVELPFDNNKNETGSISSSQTGQSKPPVQLGTDLLPPLNSRASPGSNRGHSESNQVNFGSKFEATTPDYPKSVEPTSPDPSNVGLLPPLENGASKSQQKGINLEQNKFEKTFNRRIDEEDPLVLGNTFNSRQLTEFMLTMKPEQLKDLKNMWHIPDYDFPLESVSGPNYGSELSSFQAKPSRRR
ncbi:uncharacterized protein LOC115890644 isoform X2 [Sitophilus oryzae]|uniref:Uncharacterized protein LOC115890644 isoform X2 n=1 Tax=Sitophilus oryzae TaxID=7048 RepID=A0A6J2YVC5_SITOR|nr:uncharacterized protein LOC115890644 isoform X2 [Sitophilus oryzae]